jgi:hypothetical protein
VPGNPQLAGGCDAVVTLRRLPRLDPAIPSEGLGIAGHLVSLRRLAGFTDSLDEWGPPGTPDDSLDDLIGAAARVLAAREDAPVAFCHAVTAPPALRLVLPELPSQLQRASVAASERGGELATGRRHRPIRADDADVRKLAAN